MNGEASYAIVCLKEHKKGIHTYNKYQLEQLIYAAYCHDNLGLVRALEEFNIDSSNIREALKRNEVPS